MNWVHRDMLWPRTLTGWRELIVALRAPVFPKQSSVLSCIPCIPAPPYNPDMVPDVLFHRAEAATQLEAFFYRTQALRYQMRRLFLAWSIRKMGRRVIGDTDVGTLEAIPSKALVRLYDWRSRAVYQFHYRTAYQQLVGSLRYQTMALSSPKHPKNPYTNLPWSKGQLVALYDQVHPLMWALERQFLEPAVQVFYRSRLCLTRFRKVFQHQLDMDCAHQFFHDPTSEYWDEIYTETLLDLFDVLVPENAAMVRTLLVDRSLPAPLLKSWDTLLYGFWCFENLNRIVLNNVVSEQDMYERARHLLHLTAAHIQKRRMAKKKTASPT